MIQSISFLDNVTPFILSVGLEEESVKFDGLSLGSKLDVLILKCDKSEGVSLALLIEFATSVFGNGPSIRECVAKESRLR